MIPRAVSVSRKVLSNERKMTGLGDKMNSSNNVMALNPKIFRILSSGRNVIIGPRPDNSFILPRVEKYGLIVNG